MTDTAVELSEIEMDGYSMPGTADEFASLLEDGPLMTKLQAEYGPEVWAKVNAGYMAAFRREDRGEIDEQVATMAEQQLHELLRENGLGVDGKLNVNPKTVKDTIAYGFGNTKGYHASAPGAAVEANYKGSGANAIRASLAAARPSQTSGWKDQAELLEMHAAGAEITAAYSSHIGSDGGFLLPESFRNQLLQLSHEGAVVRPRATVIPMSTPKVTIPAIHETNRTATLFGGVTIYWTEEDASSTESEAQFKTVSLEPDTMTGYSEIPNELLADAVAFDAFFSATFPRAMAFEEDDAFLQGNGVGQPTGSLNGGAVVATAKEVGQAADTVVYENVVNMMARLTPESLSRAVWVINQTVLPQLATMDNGSGGWPIFVQNAQGPFPMTLFGRPVIVTEKANTLGEQGDIALMDFGFYLIGDRQLATVTSSEHYKFKERRTAFSIVQRVDGKPWLTDPVTPRRGADTLSPFVALAVRA